MTTKILEDELSPVKKIMNMKLDKTKKLGIYIHIPFCVKKCDYCDFLSMKADEATKNKYVEALILEINSYQELAKDYDVKTIYIGGGTPSCIKEEYIVKILDTVFKVFSINELRRSDLEVTIEVNPGTINFDKLFAYKKAGINRLSIGLQSANNEELNLLGRIHTFEEFVNNYQLAREVGFHNINVDLMSGLPKQGVDQFRETLQKVIALAPEHISAYSLIIEEGTAFYNQYAKDSSKVEDLPGEDIDREIYSMTKEYLKDNGYERYEISNYSKKGYQSRHNSSYWRRIDYIGMGVGASSLLHNVRHHNENNMEEYIRLSKDYKRLQREIEYLSAKEQMEEYMFLGLRMCEGIQLSEFSKFFGQSIKEVYGDALSALIRKGLLELNKDSLFLTEKGLDVSNYVFTEFLLD